MPAPNTGPSFIERVSTILSELNIIKKDDQAQEVSE